VFHQSVLQDAQSLHVSHHVLTHIQVHRNVCVLTSLQTEESTTGIHRTSSVMIVAHAQKSASPPTTGITRDDSSNGMRDPQISKGRNRFSGSQGREFMQQQGPLTYGSPQHYGPQNFGQTPYGSRLMAHTKILVHRTSYSQRQITAPRPLYSHTCRCPSQLIPHHLPTWRRGGTLDKGQALHRRHSVSNVQNDG